MLKWEIGFPTPDVGAVEAGVVQQTYLARREGFWVGSGREDESALLYIRRSHDDWWGRVDGDRRYGW